MHFLETTKIRNTTLKNKIIMPPMCMYEAENGHVMPFHIQHYGARSLGGVGLIITEATAVSPEGRISDQDLGLWDDSLIEGQRNLVEEIHRYGAKAAIQLAHAGRKSESCASPHLAPSAIAFSDDYMKPVEMSISEIKDVQSAFIQAALRAEMAGFDGIEIHAAHGYLLHEFLSPLTNLRTDEYGQDRARILRELITDMRLALKDDTFLMVRISASDYDDAGLKPNDLVEILRPVKDKLDAVHVSSGGNVVRKIPLGPMYQVEFAALIKEELDIPVIAVGLITNAEEIETIIIENKADYVALGRELLRNPYFVNMEYKKAGMKDLIPEPYIRAYK